MTETIYVVECKDIRGAWSPADITALQYASTNYEHAQTLKWEIINYIQLNKTKYWTGWTKPSRFRVKKYQRP